MFKPVIVLDFGGQYSHLIARRVRDLGVYCEIVPHTAELSELRAKNPQALIFTGGPNSVYTADAPVCSREVLDMGIPVLGICYGAQLIAFLDGGEVKSAPSGEYGRVKLMPVMGESVLFEDFPESAVCWMSHQDYIAGPPEGYTVTAATASCPCAAMENKKKRIYAVQFHPEVEHTEQGDALLKRFLYDAASCEGGWQMRSYVDDMVEQLRVRIGTGRVLCAMSGGVDSTVSAVMVHRAVGKNLTCIFVDHGLLRKDEVSQVETACRDKLGMNLIRVDAGERFLKRLAGVTEPEQKRKIIGEEFIRVFEEQAKELGSVDYLVQGTIYPDVIESGTGGSAVIKSHHNVGGLPDVVDFKEIIEPLRMLFKDEVRRAGLELGLDERLVWRQPFPGPGLGIRVVGEITEEKLKILREADAIFREEIDNAKLERKPDQYFAVLTGIRSVGVMGDFRTYDYTLALRAVSTTDFMTADFSRLPYDLLERVSARIINEVKNVNRIVYDITPKPPATIEWE